MRQVKFAALVLLLVGWQNWAQAQSVGYTSTADSASAWLKALSLPNGAGGIGVLTGSVGYMAIPPGPGRDYIDQNGMVAFYANTSLAQQQFANAAQRLRQDMNLMSQLGVNIARSACMAPWGMMEPAVGDYQYAYMDTTVIAAGEYGVNLLMTLIPYNDWATDCNPGHPMCDIYTGGDDYFFLNNDRTGPICADDTTAWYNFVFALAERYDGDGVSDMPGLIQPVLWYEFGNEPEGPCGSYDTASYVRDYLTTLRALNAACPACQITNGGHLNSNDSLFWIYVLDNLAPHLDAGNIHVNEGKHATNFLFTQYTGRAFNLFHNRLLANGQDIPIWTTEWGVYSGAPVLGPNTLPLRTERAQAALYAKYATWGWANGLTRFFYDLKGTNSNGIGSSALFQDGITVNWRLGGLTVKLFDYFLRDATNGQQFIFMQDSALNAGHFRFMRNGLPLDVVWGLQSLPGNWQGTVVVWDIFGNADTTLVQDINTPIANEPLILEWLPTTASADIASNPFLHLVAYPNPVNGSEELTLALANPIGQWQIQVLSLTGQVLNRFVAQGQTHSISLAHLPVGVYAVKVSDGNHSQTLRVVVQ